MQAVERRIYPAVDGNVGSSSRGLIGVVDRVYTDTQLIDRARLTQCFETQKSGAEEQGYGPQHTFHLHLIRSMS